MKWFGCIFSLYILSLCAYPCQDNGDHSGFTSNQIQKEKSCDGHHDENCTHKCSPFCFCNCCHVSTVISVPLFLQVFVTIPIVRLTTFVESRLPEIHHVIWQPPKI